MKTFSLVALLVFAGVARAQSEGVAPPVEKEKKFSATFEMDFDGVPAPGWGLNAPDGSTRELEKIESRKDGTVLREINTHFDASGKKSERLEMNFDAMSKLASVKQFDGADKLLAQYDVVGKPPVLRPKAIGGKMPVKSGAIQAVVAKNGALTALKNYGRADDISIAYFFNPQLSVTKKTVTRPKYWNFIAAYDAQGRRQSSKIFLADGTLYAAQNWSWTAGKLTRIESKDPASEKNVQVLWTYNRDGRARDITVFEDGVKKLSSQLLRDSSGKSTGAQMYMFDETGKMSGQAVMKIGVEGMMTIEDRRADGTLVARRVVDGKKKALLSEEQWNEDGTHVTDFYDANGKKEFITFYNADGSVKFEGVYNKSGGYSAKTETTPAK